MATAEPISIFLHMIWINIFAYDHNFPHDQILGTGHALFIAWGG